MFEFLPEPLRIVPAFLIVLGVVVFIHELGHYIAAHWAGIHVEVFSIGFGQAVWQRADRAGTVWKICWLPLGGYVKMHGHERPEDVPAEERANWDLTRTFHHKSLSKRSVVVAAGPVANFLLAVVMFAGLFFFVGKPTGEVAPVVLGISPGGAAERAGMMVGDRVVAVAGSPIGNFEDIRRMIAPRPGETLAIGVERNGHAVSLNVTVGSQGSGVKQIGMLGIAGGQPDLLAQTLGESLIGGVTYSWTVAEKTLSMLGEIFRGERGAAELSGVFGIAKMSGDAAKHGPVSLISLIPLLSVNLGLINLFPIPVLDGGHLLFYAVEGIIRRPLPPRAMEYCFRVGFVFLMGLFVFATWNDFSNFGWISWVARLFG